MTQPQMSTMLLGALVADAASLGVHWIYDPDRIAEIAARQGGKTAFTPIDAANYADTKGYFAHGLRRLRLAIQSMNAHGRDFDVAAYQSAFTAHFGPGGTYLGYIDKPTRAALDNILAEKSPSGTDDDQNPAVARLPAIFARYHGKANLPERMITAMEVTNVNDVAGAYNAVFADVLSRVTQNEPVQDALQAAAVGADRAIRSDLLGALSETDQNSTDYAGLMGRACHLPTAGPVVFHILNNCADYRDAVERNNLAGGDSAGRSIMIGAVMGCAYGVATQKGIPLSWVLQLEESAQIWQECATLAGGTP